MTIAHTVAPGSTVYDDEATHRDALHARFLTQRINHSVNVSYSDGEACTNQAESFFSRLRRAEIGIHHHVAGPSAYANELAGRENNRRISNGEQYLMATDAALARPVSRQWKGIGNAQFLSFTKPSAANRFSMSRIRDRAISARLVPYIFDGSKSIIVSIASLGSVTVNEVLPGAVAIVRSTMSWQCPDIVVYWRSKSESTQSSMFAWIKKAPSLRGL